MRHKHIIATLIAASLLHLGSVAADDVTSSAVAAEASAPVVSKTLSGGSKDRASLIAAGAHFAPDPVLFNVETEFLDSARLIHRLPVYLTTLRLRL